MIIDNGYMQLVEITEGGFSHGIPIAATETVGEPLPCNIKTNQYNHRGKTIDGVFTQAAFVVTIDSMAVEKCTAEEVILTDSRHAPIGRYRIQDIQYLDSVGAIQITVTNA